jgi:hypothetical protein
LGQNKCKLLSQSSFVNINRGVYLSEQNVDQIEKIKKRLYCLNRICFWWKKLRLWVVSSKWHFANLPFGQPFYLSRLVNCDIDFFNFRHCQVRNFLILNQYFTVFYQIFFEEQLSFLPKFQFISFHEWIKSFALHKIRKYLVKTIWFLPSSSYF